jgi:hypothetical protein
MTLVGFTTTLLSLSLLGLQEPLAAALIYGVPLVATILLPPVFARGISWLEHNLVRNIIYLSRIIFFLLLLIFLLVFDAKPEYSYAAYIAIILFSSLDQVLTSTTPIVAKDKFGFSYSKTNSFSNIIGRGGQSVIPVFASLFVDNVGWIEILFLSLLAFSGILFPYIMPSNGMDAPTTGTKGLSSDKSPGMKFAGWAKWFVSFSLLANLSQGAVSFLLLSSEPFGVGPYYLTTLYGSFFLVQILITVGVIDFTSYNYSPLTVTYLNAINALFIFALYFKNIGILIWPTLFIIGSLYGLSIPLLSEVIIGRLRGPRFLEYLAYSKSVGRVGSLLAVWSVGLLLQLNISASTLFASCGIMLLLSSLFLNGYAKVVVRRPPQ